MSQARRTGLLACPEDHVRRVPDAQQSVRSGGAEAAARLASDLALFLDADVPVLPARGVLYGADVAPAPHVIGERQQALAALAAGGVVVAEAVALLERFLPLELQPRPRRVRRARRPHRRLPGDR